MPDALAIAFYLFTYFVRISSVINGALFTMTLKSIVKKALLLSAFSMISTPSIAESWSDFLTGVEAELVQKGMDASIFNTAMEGVKAPNPKVHKKLKKQPESTFTFADYRGRMVSETRIRNGKERIQTFGADLRNTQGKYGIPLEVIVSLWGIESVFGKKQGTFKIIPSLATLAYQSHRKEFFRKELIRAVQIVEEGHIELVNLTGSWAGAMGQCQFMPSSFFTFAADGNGDGRKDIWQTEQDVFASAANYLMKSGWKPGMNWGEAVTLSKILPKIKLSERGLSDPKPLSEWYAMGILHKRVPAKEHRGGGRMARLFMPDGPSGRSYLVYENFDVIMKWNRSSYFAFSVLNLADRLAGRGDL